MREHPGGELLLEGSRIALASIAEHNDEIVGVAGVVRTVRGNRRG